MREKLQNNNNMSPNNSERKQQQCYLPKLTIPELIQEQINFCAYFSNLLMFILGKTSNMTDSNIDNDLNKKYNERLVNSENIYLGVIALPYKDGISISGVNRTRIHNPH